MQITSAKHKAIRAIINGANPAKVKGLEPKAGARIQQQLSALQAATSMKQVADSFPAWHVHELTPGYPGKWSLRVTPNFRLTFRLNKKTNEISDLDFEDYH